MLFHDGMEDIEAITPLDVLRRAEIDVTTVSAGSNQDVLTKCSVQMRADESALNSLDLSEYGALVLPGGPGVRALRENSLVGETIRKLYDDGKWIAAICAAPLLLKDQGFLENYRYTSHTTTEGELPDRDVEESVVVDGQLITSQGAGTAMDFALTLVSLWKSGELAAQIADSICLPNS